MKTKVKTTWKRIIAVILCAVIVASGIGMDTAYAAKKKAPLKVTFNGVTVALIDDIYNEKAGSRPKFSTLIKKWGEPTEKETNESGATHCVWEKGKTRIYVDDQWKTKKDGRIGEISFVIGDKNGAMCGVTVGMKANTAYKKLQNVFGKKRVLLVKKGQQVICNEKGQPVLQGKAKGGTESIAILTEGSEIRAPGGIPAFGPNIKNGKVSSFSFFTY